MVKVGRRGVVIIAGPEHPVADGDPLHYGGLGSPVERQLLQALMRLGAAVRSHSGVRFNMELAEAEAACNAALAAGVKPTSWRMETVESER